MTNAHDVHAAAEGARHAWEDFHFCPRCGASYDGTSLKRPPTMLHCAGCGYEFYQHSSVAATAVIPSPDGRVLLLTRATNPGRGLLALAGGFLDYDERPEDGVVREVSEEIQRPVEIECLLDSYLVAYRYRGAMVSVLELAYLAKPLDGELGQVSNREVQQIAYYDTGEVIDGPAHLAFPEQRRSLIRFRDHRRLQS